MILLLACAPEPEVSDRLDPVLLARRTSLDLRGILPSEAELDAVEADPDALTGLRREWMGDPHFEDRLVQLLQERWYTRTDTFDITWYDYGLDEDQAYEFARAVGEEPLRLIARVVSEDQPWSEVVTADWTMTDAILAEHWPVETAGEGWQPATYTDGRPAAGVLATNGLWWRYTTNTSNMNRGRSAAISRLLLCEDVLSRPVDVSFAGATITDPEAAARTEPACLSCHASLDPVAASLFGFWWLNMYSTVEETRYHPEREQLYEDLGVEPGWYGEPIEGLSELGWAVAQDPRFYRCAVESFAEGYWRRSPGVDDFDTIEAFRADFVADGARPQALIEAILDSDEYALATSDDPAVRTTRMLTPDQLASAVEDLTGFTWTEAGVPLLDEDTHGFRLLAGGVDGSSAFSPQREPGLTWTLVIERLAQGAGDYSAQNLGSSGPLADVAPGSVPGDADFDAALESLHRRMYGTRATKAWTADISALWEEVDANDGEQAAWASVIAVMLRDPAFVLE